MKISYELRVRDAVYDLYLREFRAERLSESIWKVWVDKDDPRCESLFSLAETLWRTEGKYLYSSCSTIRKPSKDELENGELFTYYISKVFEPTGEECGTIYNDENCCRDCWAGTIQEGTLRLSKVPTTTEVANTYVGEEIFSARIIEQLSSIVNGVDFRQVVDKRNVSRPWFQMLPNNAVQLSSLTEVGESRFYSTQQTGCPKGWVNHVAGLCYFDQLKIERSSWTGGDIVHTTSFFGRKAGLFRPRRETLVSKRVVDVFTHLGIKNIKFFPVALID